MGYVIMTVLGMVSQMERRFIKERQREGIERAKAKGVYRGAKVRSDRALILRLHAEKISVAEIAKQNTPFWMLIDLTLWITLSFEPKAPTMNDCSETRKMTFQMVQRQYMFRICS
jgi:hypothetical protein